MVGARGPATMRPMTFEAALELVVKGFEALGVGILVIGSTSAFVAFARNLRRMDRTLAYERLRAHIGRTILDHDDRRDDEEQGDAEIVAALEQDGQPRRTSIEARLIIGGWSCT